MWDRRDCSSYVHSFYFLVCIQCLFQFCLSAEEAAIKCYAEKFPVFREKFPVFKLLLYITSVLITSNPHVVCSFGLKDWKHFNFVKTPMESITPIRESLIDSLAGIC